MLTIEDFKKPTSHPFGMLEGEGLSYTFETEGFMGWFLGACIKAKDIDAEIKTKFSEDHLANKGLNLLQRVGPQTYKLTRKAKGLLYIHYGK